MNWNFERAERCECGALAVYYGPDPYAEEIAGDETLVYLCDDCYLQSCGDI